MTAIDCPGSSWWPKEVVMERITAYGRKRMWVAWRVAPWDLEEWEGAYYKDKDRAMALAQAANADRD